MGWSDKLIRAVGAQAPPSRLPAMLAARRAILDNRVADGVSTLRVPRYTPAAGLPDEFEEFFAAFMRNITDDERAAARSGTELMSGRGALGVFSPTPGERRVGVASYPVDDYSTRRHEIMHGYTEAARRGHPGMPLISQAAARLPHFLGRPLDEAAAQVVGGTRLRDIPWGRYADIYRQQGEAGPARVAAALDGAQRVGRSLPEAAAAAATTTAVAGAGIAIGLPQDRSRTERAEAQTAKYAPPPQYFDREDEVLRPRRPSPPLMFEAGPVELDEEDDFRLLHGRELLLGGQR
jgi:hypothetical protein